MTTKVFTRSNDRVVAGVCGGIADFFDMPAWPVRILYVVGSAMSAAFPGLLVYLVLWVILPKPPAEERRFSVHHPDAR